MISVRGTRLGKQRIAQRVAEIAQEANIGFHVTPHMLRHSFATHLIQRGMNIFDVKKLLGHKTIDSTQHYIHLSKTIDNG